MNILEIENRIERAIDSVVRSGYTIVQHHWGIYNCANSDTEENNWISGTKMCCPLGAVVICSKLKVADPILKNLPNSLSVKYNPFYYVMKEFGVNGDWINSFNMGFDDLRIKYWGNQVAHSLGVKMRYRYAGQSITI